MSVQAAIQCLQQGRPIILMDHADRENEGDLVFPAEMITTEIVNLMIRHGSGIVCLCLTPERLDHLQLPLMVPNNKNTNRHGLCAMISIEAKKGITTGVCAADRTRTILTAVDDKSTAADLASPGHIFPLRAASGGLKERQGHTEGSIEIVKRAGFKSAAVICELMNPDGTMARGKAVTKFAKKHQLAVTSIEELLAAF